MDGKKFSVGVIISTYNNPEWLEKTLCGFVHQTHPADEILIADDGSGPETKALLERYSELLPIRHVWHEDNGFRKTEILNRAVAESTADYLIFTDQDLVPRADFIETHVRHARKGAFLSGGCYRLPMEASRAITEADIASGAAFNLGWLHEHGLEYDFRCSKLLHSPLFASVMNHITPAKATWNGGNASAWRTDILLLDGFDMRLGYGGEDREFGERMVNAGMKPVQIRYSAVLLHLDHPRPYRRDDIIAYNNSIRRITRRTRIIRTEHGISTLDDR